MARPNRLVSAPEAAEYYYPAEFRAASIEPVARGQYAQMFGSDSVINPMSWGGYLPEEMPQTQQAQINPEILQYEKDLQQNETTDKYYGIIGRMHDMARTAAKGGFDINDPDPLNSVQRELSKIYRGLKQEALQIAEQAKQGREIEKNMPKLMAQNYLPADEQLRNQRGYYDPSALTQAAPRIENPAVKAFNLQTSPQYENTTDVGDIVAQRDRIVADLQYVIDNDPNPQNVQRAMDDLRSINQFAITKDYDPQKLALARQKMQQVSRRASGTGEFAKLKIVPSNFINKAKTGKGEDDTATIAMQGYKIVPDKKDGNLMFTGLGSYIDANDYKLQNTNDVYPYAPTDWGAMLVAADTKNQDGKVVVKGKTLRPSKNEKEAIEWINSVKTLDELKKYQPKYAIVGTVFDKNNVTNSVDAQGNSFWETKNGGGTNRTIIKLVDDEEPLKNNILSELDAKTGGSVAEALQNPDSEANKLFSAYARKYEELSKGKQTSTDKPKTIGW